MILSLRLSHSDRSRSTFSMCAGFGALAEQAAAEGDRRPHRLEGVGGQLLRHQADLRARRAVVAHDVVAVGQSRRPAVGVTMPQTMLISVVLPAPLGPSSAKISPSRISRSMRLQRLEARGVGLGQVGDGDDRLHLLDEDPRVPDDGRVVMCIISGWLVERNGPLLRRRCRTTDESDGSGKRVGRCKFEVRRWAGKRVLARQFAGDARKSALGVRDVLPTPQGQGGRAVKIAQIAPLAESVPPQLYGGTERIVSYLTEELVRQGHDVTLFASGDSHTAANSCRAAKARCGWIRRVGTRSRITWSCSTKYAGAPTNSTCCISTSIVLHYPLIAEFADRNRDHVARPARPAGLATVLRRVSRRFRSFPFRGSSAHRCRAVLWVGNVYHGLPKDLLRLNAHPRGGLLRVPRADFAREATGPCHRDRERAGVRTENRRENRSFRRTVLATKRSVRWWTRTPNVEFIGEIAEIRKQEFLGNARGAAVPDRLARTFRPRHDRGHGLWHTGRRLQLRLGARSHRRGRDWLRGRRCRRAVRAVRRSSNTWTAQAVRALRRARSRRAHGA